MEQSHHFYVVACSDGSFYTGYTNNIKKRLAAHNAGKGAKYTRARLPVMLLYTESFPSKTEAMRMEYAFKQLSRKQKEQYMNERRGQHEITKKL